MPPVARHKAVFLREVTSCRALFRHCLAPRGLHSDAGVEAAFLQMFKAWESLLEECTLSFMCGRLRLDGSSIVTYTTSRDEEWARKVVYQDRSYVEWTDLDKIVTRWQGIFAPPNPLEAALRPARVELRHMTTIRNAIAHSSASASKKFRDLVQGQFGGRRRFDRPAALLAEPWPADASLTFFDRFADVLETVTPGMTG